MYEHDICINIYTPHVAATSFFTGEVEIFDFVTERVKKCIAAKRDEVFGEIFYRHNVVGGVVNCTNDIYGVRTSLFLSSQRMPSRYGCVHIHIQL